MEGCVTAGAKIHVTCVRSNTSKVVKKNKDILHLVERGLAARGGGGVVFLNVFDFSTFRPGGGSKWSILVSFFDFSTWGEGLIGSILMIYFKLFNFST